MASIQIDIKDGLSSSVAVKGPCRVATTANITLSGEQTIDGVAVVTDDRVLVMNQTTASENGIYVVDTGAWRRSKDFNKTKDIKTGTMVNVTAGTVGSGWWQVSTTGDITVGTTSIAFSRVFGASAGDFRDYLDVAPYVATRTALKALDTTKDTAVLLKEAGREGTFIWKTGDYSAQIAADTQEGVYLKADAIASTSGAWVRVYSRLSVEFFGASTSATAAANTTAIQAAVNFAQSYTGYLFFPALYPISGTIAVSNNVVLEGVSAFTSGVTCNNGDAISLVPSTLIANNNTWYGFRYLSIISTVANPTSYGISYLSTGSEYLSNWQIEGCYVSGLSMGANFDSRSSAVGIFSCTFRRNWFDNGLRIYDGGDSITIVENTVNGSNGIIINALKSGARQLVIRNNNTSALAECIYVITVIGPVIEGNWAETPYYLGSYNGATGGVVTISDCSNTRLYRNTIQPLASLGGGFVPAAYAVKVIGTGSLNIIDDNDIAIGGTGHIHLAAASISTTTIGGRNKFDVARVITDSGTSTSYDPVLGVFDHLATFRTASQFTSVISAECTDAGAGNGPYYDIYRNSASPAASDGLGGLLWYGQNSTPAKTNYAYITATILDPTAASEDAQINIARMVAGSLVVALTLGLEFAFSTGGTFGGDIRPLNSDGGALGNTAKQWSDLFLASGAVVNFANGNYTVTHTSGVLTFSGAVLSSGTGGVGYATGAGGTVTQATSRTTGVTLNKASGAITMFTAAGSTTPASFTVTNSTVAATDTIILNIKSGATNTYFYFVTAVAAGSFVITFWTTGGTASDAPVINFNVIKGVAS